MLQLDQVSLNSDEKQKKFYIGNILQMVCPLGACELGHKEM